MIIGGHLLVTSPRLSPSLEVVEAEHRKRRRNGYDLESDFLLHGDHFAMIAGMRSRKKPRVERFHIPTDKTIRVDHDLA